MLLSFQKTIEFYLYRRHFSILPAIFSSIFSFFSTVSFNLAKIDFFSLPASVHFTYFNFGFVWLCFE